MSAEIERGFARTEALLHAVAERGNQMDRRWEKRHEQAMARMDRADARMANSIGGSKPPASWLRRG